MALCAGAQPLLDSGSGLWAYSYVVEGPRICLGALASMNAPTRLWARISAWGASHAGAIGAIYRTHPADAVSLLDAAPWAAELRESLEEHGAQDMLTVISHAAGGSGIILAAPQSRRVSLTRVEHRALSRFASELAAVVRLRSRRGRSRQASTALSRAEREVARLLVEGLGDKCIARELGVAMSTVSTLAHRMRRKLRCRPGEEILQLAPADDASMVARRCALFAELTPSERAVAVELVIGLSYGEIATLRGSATRTIAAQAASIFRKARVSGRRQLAVVLLGGRPRLS
jgi:DNA-binding NarL/FixJ family response regulator